MFVSPTSPLFTSYITIQKIMILSKQYDAHNKNHNKSSSRSIAKGLKKQNKKFHFFYL